MNKICILNVYFGKFKNYFELWLRSCSYNKDVDFLIISDNSIDQLPANVRLINMEFKEFVNLATEKLQMPIAFDMPYKCCDFRPAYGIILEDYLKQYDYWGHCDIDMIWGDLTCFLKKYDLYKYDKFLYLGHLSLYRNVPEINNAFKLEGSKIGDYIKVFTTPENLAFDEMNGIWSIFKYNNKKVFGRKIFADISSIYSRFRLAEVCFGDEYLTKNYKNQVFYYAGGKVFRAFIDNEGVKTEEFVYIHFKQRPNFVVNFNVKDTDCFYITPKGFYPKSDSDDILDIIYKYNRYSRVKEIIEYIRFRVSLLF